MEWIHQILDQIKKFLLEKFDVGRADFWGGIFSWVVIGILVFIFVQLYKGTLSGFLFLQRKVVYIPRALRLYKKNLEDATLTIRHSWKLDGQDFRQLLVPVHFNMGQENSRLEIEDFVKKNLSSTIISRFVLIGEPGGGKSVAMGSIAREIWSLGRKPPIVPILMTFSDIKHVSTQEDFEFAVIKSLQRHHFERGKRTKRAHYYAESKLYTGQLLILLDGFDELEKTERQECARFLEDFFNTYPQIPFVVSSRTAVWKDSPGVFATLHPSVISMVRFNNGDIRQFLGAWNFSGNKSSEQLGELIRTKPYLQTIAENPLMLTIIAFLYAQPKRILPDNRVKFYQECVDALMEKFDNAKQIERANEFDTIHKVNILSHIAYEHIVSNTASENEIPKEMVLGIIKDIMDRFGRPPEKRQSMLTEIVQNTELLVEIPPDRYKFPHRTFMEYFAANYFLEENKVEELLELYKSDTGKWEETLALFCGINIQEDTSYKCLDVLEGYFDSTKTSEQPNTFVYRVLVESAKIRPEWAFSLLDKAEVFLKDNFDFKLVESLGYIGANPVLTYAKKATEILTATLTRNMKKPELTSLLVALSTNRDEKTFDIIAKYIDALDSNGLYELLKYDTRSISSVFLKFNLNKLRKFIKAVEENADIEILLSILKHTVNSDIKVSCAKALAQLSKNRSFYNTLCESDNFGLSNAEEVTYNLFKNWDWEKYGYMNEGGKKMLSLIIHYLVYGFKKDKEILEFDKAISSYLKYHLFSALNHEKLFAEYSDQFANCSFSKLESAWEKKNSREQFDNIFVVCFLIVIIVSFLMYETNYGIFLGILSLITVTSFILEVLLEDFSTKISEHRLGRWFLVPIMTHGLFFGFYNKKTRFFLPLIFGIFNIIAVANLSIFILLKILYLFPYIYLFLTQVFVERGLVSFIRLPAQITGLLKND